MESDYNGIRLTADGFDCALPLTIDSFSKCSYNCLYCFSGNLVSHGKTLKIMNIKRIDNLFNTEYTDNKRFNLYRKILKYDNKKNGYPTAVQVGGLADPCDEYSKKSEWLKDFLKLCIKYNQPARISTKGTILKEDEYINILKENPKLFWIAFSIISGDEETLRKIDKGTPILSERLKTMKAVTDIGCKASLRFRPIIPGISDVVNGKKVYKDLIKRAKDSGAKAISYEVLFAPTRLKGKEKNNYESIKEIINLDLEKEYLKGSRYGACIRPSSIQVENIMNSIYEESKKVGFDVGVSDPNWKQLNDFGCCCGINPNDEVFGNWQKENATNMLIEGKNGKKELNPLEYIPEWSKEIRMGDMANMGAGPKNSWKKKHLTWFDKLRAKYNDLRTNRGCYKYFDGALKPLRVDENNNIIWEYKGLVRKNKDYLFKT